ncbi:MAG: PP2C family protein-serine/threonine phosphatase, partial [Acidimicrobiales bacterium]
ALVVGQVVTGPRAGAFRRAEHAGQLVATPLIGSGSRRALGFALGPPAAPAGEVLYEQAVIGPVSSPPRAATAPFSELNVVLYASPRAEPSQELFSTTPDLPLDRPSHFQSLVVGASDWLLGVNAPAPLVGSAEASALWAVMAVGVVVALLVTAVVEVGMRRRDAALALYAGEHDLAETLQRSLLPDLPALPGLELASRYLAGGRGQEVGGDWFDAFPLGGDRVGLVIGDVAGHDIAAAATMSQVRATVRAYAAQGDQPAAVLDRLDGLVGRFGVAQLVTVFYGALDPPGADGSRLLRYANAGHLPPLLEDPGGAVDSLAEGASVVIGAPMAGPRAQAERRLLPGSTLVLFTDGLVEVPGRSLEDCLVELADSVAADHPPTRSPEQLCEHLVSAAPGGQLRDDVALLAVRVLVTQPAAPVSPAPAAVVPSAAHLGEVRADVPGSQGAGRLVPPLEGPGPEPGRGGGRLG